jgi:hypothetical protein
LTADARHEPIQKPGLVGPGDVVLVPEPRGHDETPDVDPMLIDDITDLTGT